MKRILLVVAVVVVAPVIAFAAVMAATFAGQKEMVDGTELTDGARLVKDGFAAAFVLPAGDAEVALIDCGNDPEGKAILAELSRRGLGPDSVKGIFLTHGHPDHTAACHLFHQAHVYAAAAEVAVVAGEQRTKGPLPSMMPSPENKRARVTDALQDGEIVTVGNLSVKAYPTPGHTAGSVTYLVNGTLYFGDTASGASDGTVRAAPWVFSDDVAQNRQAIEALASRLRAEHAEVKKLAFAHSGPLDGVDALNAFRAAN